MDKKLEKNNFFDLSDCLFSILQKIDNIDEKLQKTNNEDKNIEIFIIK